MQPCDWVRVPRGFGMFRLRKIDAELHDRILEAESDLMSVKRAAVGDNNPKEARRIFNNQFPDRAIKKKHKI